jgi:hypothetical protein
MVPESGEDVAGSFRENEECSGGGIIPRDAPGKERDARSPGDIVSFHSDSINTFLFINA